MLGRLPRLALFALLSATLLVSGWLLFPTYSQHLPRNAAPVPGQGAGDQLPDPKAGDRDERVSRNSRVKPAPSRSEKPSPTPRRSPVLTGDALLESKVIELVNSERAGAGCGAVHLDNRLRTAARGHSEDMARHDKLSHEGSDGSSPWDRAEAAGYDQAMSENVAMGYGTAKEVVAAWMDSDGHRKNILDCDAKATGVGLARTSDGTPYWTQMFGRT